MAKQNRVWTKADRKQLEADLAACKKYLQETGEMKVRTSSRSVYTLMAKNIVTDEVEELGRVVGASAMKQLGEVLRPQLEDRYTDAKWVIAKETAL